MMSLLFWMLILVALPGNSRITSWLLLQLKKCIFYCYFLYCLFRIEMVNGQDLAKFWAVYQLHDRPHIRALLEEYRIGNLSSCDYLRVKRETSFESYYTNEPARPQGEMGQLRSPSTHPWNSEPKVLARLTDTFFTPNDLFFKRNHNNVPLVTKEDYVLEIEANENAGAHSCMYEVLSVVLNY
jgi:hypothetical protein